MGRYAQRAQASGPGCRSVLEGERNIQGFFTAYLSVNAYYLMAPEMELSHGYCDLFLMPDLMRYEVKHSYILELQPYRDNLSNLKVWFSQHYGFKPPD